MFCSKAMLFIGKDEILIKMLHNLGMDNVFENLATNCCEEDGTVIGWVGTVIFF